MLHSRGKRMYYHVKMAACDLPCLDEAVATTFMQYCGDVALGVSRQEAATR